MTDDNLEKLTIVGGGLVGSLAALILARRGHEIDLYERRADIRGAGGAGGRSINLVLTERGVRALDLVGLVDKAMRLTVAVTGRMMHTPEGEQVYQPYGRDASECNYSISRGDLNAFLIDEAESAGVRLHFDHTLIEADLESSRLRFRTASGETTIVDGATLLGTDGVGSALRASFAGRPGYVDSLEMLDYGYKELLIPVAESGESRIEKHALHIWARGRAMLMALPNVDGSFTVTLYLPHTGVDSFQSLDSPEAVTEIFGRLFSDAVPLIPGLTTEFFENPTGELGTLRCHPWNIGNRVLLIGDSAHAVVPFFGQGMNAGFEDCRILDELLEAEQTANPGRVFAELSRIRKPDTDAIADMALENFVEMRDRVADDAFLLRKRVEHRLELEMPNDYRTRYSMVMYSHIPYHIAQAAGRLHEQILDELCEGLESADDLDLDTARRLIAERLTPYLEREGVRLDY